MDCVSVCEPCMIQKHGNEFLQHRTCTYRNLEWANDRVPAGVLCSQCRFVCKSSMKIAWCVNLEIKFERLNA